MRHLYGFIALSILLSACAEIGTTVVNTTSRLLGDYTVQRDIPFGSHNQAFDVYAPESIKQDAPVVVFFYGGGWNAGDKANFLFVADALTRHGFITVIPNYRKYPQVQFPAFMYDGAQAIAWTVDNIAQYGGNADRLYLMGHSAGAHLGALLLADRQYLNSVNIDVSQLCAFAGLAGPYSFTPQKEKYKRVFANSDNYRLMQVDNFIDGSEPPMLLQWGKDDSTVGKINIERLVEAVEAKSGQVQVRLYEDLSHIGILASLSRPLSRTAPVLEDTAQFFERHDDC